MSHQCDCQVCSGKYNKVNFETACELELERLTGMPRKRKGSNLHGSIKWSKKEKEWLMDEILDKMFSQGIAHYLISWKGYGPEKISWEPKKNILCPVMLQNFEEIYQAWEINNATQ